MKNQDNVQFKLTFLGAAETVTGSSFLLEISEGDSVVAKIMVDHGMFQGPDVESRNERKYEFDPSEIDLLLITHAHVDHCGMIPRLVASGYAGDIIMTKPTADIAELILLDSAKIQLRNYQNDGKDAYFAEADVWQSTTQFVEIEPGEEYEYETKDEAHTDVKFISYKAGHILGAVSYLIEYKGKSIVFSGDLGRRTQELLDPFDPIARQVDYVVMESLYGGKFHGDSNELYREFGADIAKTIAGDGNVIIPTFSTQRTQEMLIILNRLAKTGVIPKGVQIYFDSPLAQRVSKVYTNNSTEIPKAKIAGWKNLKAAFYPKSLTIVRKYSETKAIFKKKGVIILTGGGMINGGKVLSYLKAMARDPKNLLTIVGFQAEGTLGRDIVSGVDPIEIDGNKLPLNLQMRQYSGFSAHADQEDLLAWLGSMQKSAVKKVFLVHAEVEQSAAFKRELEPKGYNVVIPSDGESIAL